MLDISFFTSSILLEIYRFFKIINIVYVNLTIIIIAIIIIIIIIIIVIIIIIKDVCRHSEKAESLLVSKRSEFHPRQNGLV